MSKIVRYQGDVRAFASDAQGMERTVFGGTNQADDLTSQITASFLRGWGIVGASEHPSLEDFNAAMYAMSQFIAYQHQMGVPEWHAEQEYYIGSICTLNGESYQSLEDNNVGSAPPSAKWTTILTAKNGLAKLGLGDGSGRYLGTRVFTASGTYTPPAGMQYALVYVLGAGGGSGSAPATSSTQTSASPGGASGSWAFVKLLASDIGASQTYVVGQGGAAGIGGAGGNGGPSSFGSLISAPGGNGSPAGVAISTTASALIPGGAPGGVPTISSGTVLESSNGSPGGKSTFITSNTLAGDGASSPKGSGGQGLGGTSPASPGSGNGSGGSGASCAVSSSAKNGAAGANGGIWVMEFA